MLTHEHLSLDAPESARTINLEATAKGVALICGVLAPRPGLGPGTLGITAVMLRNVSSIATNGMSLIGEMLGKLNLGDFIFLETKVTGP